MKKKALAFAAIMIIAGVSTLISCNKDVDSFTNETSTMPTKESPSPKEDEVSISVKSGEKGEILDIYHIIDPEKSIWSWRRFEYNAFVHDFDLIWQETDDIYSMKEIEDGNFLVTFEDGEQTIITDIVSSEYHTTFTLRYESGEKCQIAIKHPAKVAPIDGLVGCANGGCISSLENGGIFGAILEFIKDALRNRQQCINEVAEKAYNCNKANCIAHISNNGRSVTCFTNPFGNCSNCGSYTHSC